VKVKHPSRRTTATASGSEASQRPGGQGGGEGEERIILVARVIGESGIGVEKGGGPFFLSPIGEPMGDRGAGMVTGMDQPVDEAGLWGGGVQGGLASPKALGLRGIQSGR